MITWYYLNESGEVIGPVSEQALKELNAAGAMTTTTQVCREGTEDWIALAEVLGADTRGAATMEADTNELSAEDNRVDGTPREPSLHPGERRRGEAVHSFADRLKTGAKEGWADIERTSKAAAIHTQIEKIRNVDLRMALFALGKKCYEAGILQEDLQKQFQQIRDLDATIASKQEAGETVDAETKIDSLKRMGKDAANSSHAQALTVKRQHLVTELGRQAHAIMREECRPGLEAEIAAIEEIEGSILGQEEEVRILGTGHAKGWRNRIPAIAVAAALILLLLAGGFSGLRMIGVGKNDDFVTSKPEETQSDGASPTKRRINYSHQQEPSSNLALDEAIRSIAVVYPELTRDEHVRKLEEISGLRMTSSLNARRANETVNQLRGAAKISGQSEREFFDYSERKRIERLGDVRRIMSGRDN